MKSEQPKMEELFASPDPELRRHAIERAAKAGRAEAMELVLTALADEDWRVRKEAVKAVQRHPTEFWFVERLVSFLQPGDNVGLRNAAVEALGAHGDVAVAQLGKALPRLDVDGRKLAAEALGLSHSPEAMHHLEQLRSDPDLNVRAAALEAVAQVGRAAPEAAARLLDRALDDSEPFLRLVTLDVIRRLSLAPSWERLRVLLADPVLAQTGLELAARLGDPRAAPHFVKELTDAQGQRLHRALGYMAQFIVTSEAAAGAARDALAAMGDDVRIKLMELSRSDAEPNSTGDALLVLAAHGDSRVAPVAVARLGDDRVSGAALEALQLLGARAAQALLERLKQGEAREQATVVELLVRIALKGDERERILGVLRSPPDASPRVLRAWLSAMIQLEDEAGLLRALDYLDDGVPASVRRLAATATKTLAERFPERAAAAANGVSAESVRAAEVCWFMAAGDEAFFADLGADVAFLTAAASNPSPSVRIAALAGLSRRPDPSALDAIVFALNDEVEEVQLAAVDALGTARGDGGERVGIPYVLDFAVRNTDPMLVVEALRAIAKARDPVALGKLASWVEDELSWRAVASVEALGAYTPDLRLEAMCRALAHNDTEVVKAALQVLAFDDQIPEVDVVHCLSHSVWDVRRLAADVLGGHETSSSRDALSQRLLVEHEPLVIEAIVRSLSRFEPSERLRTIPPPTERGRDAD